VRPIHAKAMPVPLSRRFRDLLFRRRKRYFLSLTEFPMREREHHALKVERGMTLKMLTIRHF
jgi:hypothetical protein